MTSQHRRKKAEHLLAKRSTHLNWTLEEADGAASRKGLRCCSSPSSIPTAWAAPPAGARLLRRRSRAEAEAAAAAAAVPAAPVADAAPDPAPVAPARPAFEAIGEAAFAAFAERAARGFASEEAAATALAQALADERLLNLDVRTFFEWRVACLLANGWRPGHEFLFEPAVGAFAWESDPTRLGVFGALGGLIGAAIRERAAFRSQPRNLLEPQMAMLARLRFDGPVDPSELRHEMPLVQALVERCPNWLAMMAPRERINDRIERWNRIPPDRRPRPPAVAPPPAARSGGVGWLVWVALVVMGGIGRLASVSSGPTPAARPVADPVPEARIDADIERRQAQAEALLQQLVAAPPPVVAPAPAEGRRTAAPAAAPVASEPAALPRPRRPVPNDDPTS